MNEEVLCHQCGAPMLLAKAGGGYTWVHCPACGVLYERWILGLRHDPLAPALYWGQLPQAWREARSRGTQRPNDGATSVH